MSAPSSSAVPATTPEVILVSSRDVSDYGELVDCVVRVRIRPQGRAVRRPRLRPPRLTRLALAFGAGLVALEVTLAIVLVETSNHESDLGGAFILAVTAGVAFMVSGLIALWRRPDNRTGTYLAAVGYLWFLGALTESNNPWVYTAGFVLGGVALIPFAALLLAHPTGRFETRFDGLFPWIVGVVIVSFSLAIALVDPTLDPGCEDCPENPLALTDLPHASSRP